MAENEKVLLWLDYETTDVETATCGVLEVGAAISRWESPYDFVRQFDTPIRVPGEHPDYTRMQCDPYVQQLHDGNGLWEDVAARGTQPHIAEQYVLDMIGLALADLGLDIDAVDITMAGSGVERFDKPITKRVMPRLDGLLTYYCEDVASIRRHARRAWLNDAQRAELERIHDPKHRALSDIYTSRDTLAYLDSIVAPRVAR